MIATAANLIGQTILAGMAGKMLYDVIIGNAEIPAFSAFLFTFALFCIAFSSFSARLYIFGFGALFGAICWLTIGLI